MRLGDRGTRVNIIPNRQDGYDRIRPQGRRCFRALQSLGSQRRRGSGKGDGGTGDVPERRGGAGGADPFLEGPANGGGKACGVRGLSGERAQEVLSSPQALKRDTLLARKGTTEVVPLPKPICETRAK